MLSISGMLGDESPVDPRRRRRSNMPASQSPSPSSSPLMSGRQANTTTPTSTGGIVGTAISQSPPRPLRATNANLLEASPPAAPSSRKRKSTTPHPPTRQKRAPRPQYTKEQEDFIWFCRDDLSMSWRKVVELYNEQWHPENTGVHPMRSESGLQSRYYRILDFPVKVRKKKEPCRPELGLIPSTTRRYEWMGAGEEVEKEVSRQQHPREQEREFSHPAVASPMRRSNVPSFPINEPIEVDDETDQDQVQDPDSLQLCLTGGADADAYGDKSDVRQSRLMDMETDGYESSYSSSSSSTQAQQTKQCRQPYQGSLLTDYSTCSPSTLLALIRAPKISGRARQQRGIRRNRPRPVEKEKDKEKEKEERQGKGKGKAGSSQTRGKDPRLAVENLCG